MLFRPPRSKKQLILILVFYCIAALTPTLDAGIRAKGKYSGVVFFDRWDTCLLISGPYLMYISTREKEPLREYNGQAMQLDALEVFQPINPGDGLIQRYHILGRAPDEEFQRSELKDLRLHLERALVRSGQPVFALEVKNEGISKIEVWPGDIGITLLTSQSEPFGHSDGRSTAAITRASLRPSDEDSNHEDSGGGVHEWTVNGKRFHAAFRAEPHPRKDFQLAPGASLRVELVVDASPGEYQILFGYAHDVHQDKALLSNAISFNLDAQGAITNLP